MVWFSILKQQLAVEHSNVIKKNIYGLVLPMVKKIPKGEYKIAATMGTTGIGQSYIKGNLPAIYLNTNDINKALTVDGKTYDRKLLFDQLEELSKRNNAILGSFVERELFDVIRFKR